MAGGLFLIRVGFLSALRSVEVRGPSVRWVSRDSRGTYPQPWSTMPIPCFASIFEEAEAAAWILAHGDDARSSGWGPLWTELFL